VKFNTRTYKDEVVAISSLAFLLIKAANSTIMGQCRCVAVWLSNMQAQTLLTLCWCSLLGGSTDIMTIIFAYKGGQYYDHGSMPLHSPWNIQDAWPKIVDTHFQEVVVISSLAFLPIKAANIMIMRVCRCTALELSKMHDQELLTLHWHSFLGGSSNIATSIVAYNGSQYYDYGSMPLHSPWIIPNAWPKIVDTHF